ncbi:MAG: GNAT family N-acetyltransferase [Chloroflexaceae bacterium]|nr:GNAT family N-acetyltransferase [Chloroflexaceae bacterium]
MFLRLPFAPTIDGLCFRRFRDSNDYSQMAEVHRGAQVWDRVDPQSARESVPTAENLAATFPEGEAKDSPDMLLALIDDQIVGYNHVMWRWTEVTGTRVYLHLGYLLPQWRGKGIGTALLRWSQQRICELVADDRHQGDTTFATNVSSTEREAHALIQHDGYTAVRRLSDMVLTPLTQTSESVFSADVRLKAIEPEQYRAIYHTWKDAFSGTWTSTPESEEDYQQFLDDNFSVKWFDPLLYHVAWIEDHVVGFVFSRIRKGVGVIEEVAVRKAWQRQGIARGLLVRALNTLHTRGVTQVRLFTDAANEQGARGLYERFGFREVKQHIFYRKPIQA